MVSGAGLRAAVAFGANLVLVRLLLPEQFGRYATVNANISLVAALTNIKLNDLILREPDAELDDERLSLYTGAIVLQTVVVAVLAVGLLTYFDLLGIYAVLLLLSVLAATWVHAQITLFERSFDYASISVIETGAHAAGHLFTVLGAFAGLGALVLYLRLGVQITGKLLGLWAVDGLRPLPLRWLGWEDWKEVFKRVRGFWLDGALAQSFERLVIILVSVLVGERVTGFFYQARRLAVAPHQLLGQLTDRVLFNYFSHHTRGEERRSTLRRSLVGVVVVLGAVAVVTFVVADPVVPLLFGQDWRPVVPLLQAMVGMIVGMTMFNTLNAYFMSMNRLQPFIVLGRGGQYVGLFAAVGAAVFVRGLDDAIAVSLGLSAAYLLGSLASWGYAETGGISDRAARDYS